jgi:hypothetical protein
LLGSAGLVIKGKTVRAAASSFVYGANSLTNAHPDQIYSYSFWHRGFTDLLVTAYQENIGADKLSSIG